MKQIKLPLAMTSCVGSSSITAGRKLVMYSLRSENDNLSCSKSPNQSGEKRLGKAEACIARSERLG